MFYPVCDDTQRQDLYACDCLLAGLPIGEHAGEFGDFAEPAAVFFLFYFNEELHLHIAFTGRWGR